MRNKSKQAPKPADKSAKPKAASDHQSANGEDASDQKSGTEEKDKENDNDLQVCGRPFNRLAAFVSVQFASGSPQTIAGYTIGLSEHVSKYLHVMAGFSLAPIEEISPGFQAAHPTVTNFDGVSTAGYQGSPTTVHYRGGLFLGIALPVSLQSLLKGQLNTN